MTTNIAKIKVTKRDGHLEEIDLNKIHRVITWAAEDLNNVSVSQVELKSHIQFYDGIKTSDIHEMIIKSAADLISLETPDYQYMAARLLVFHLRKIAYGDFTPPSLYDHVVNMVNKGKYDAQILDMYSKEEMDELDSYIDHWRDMNFSYAGVKQLEGKYLVQNKVTKEIYESPQMAYMLISMIFFHRYDKSVRLDYVKRFYDAISLFKISLPTPIMAGLRMPSKQFSSCTGINIGDSLDSINAGTSAIVKYVSQRAGIGLNIGPLRAVGSPIRNGEIKHTGVIPFIKMFQAATHSCAMGGIRTGAATLFFPMWHYEYQDLVVLKNNRGVEDNRARHLDYCVQINGYLYKRLIKNENITLFSPSDVDGLYDAFTSDQEKFAQLYEQYENDPSIRKITLPATEAFSLLMQERAGTGRIYIQNIDHCNEHGAFNPSKAPIEQSNLCLEITLPSKPLEFINSPEGEVFLCTLAAFNIGNMENKDEFENLSDLIVRALDELLDYQDYPVLAAELSAMKRRPLGIGIINYAYFLSKHGYNYSEVDEAVNLTHEWAEAYQYYLLKASNNLAKEKGACPAFGDTKYADGILPIDTYKRDIDEFVTQELHYDWESLRKDIVEHGLRNSTLSSLMPSETSSQIHNATSGIDPVRSLITTKVSKDGVLKQVVPDLNNLKDKYQTLWSIPLNPKTMSQNTGYLKLMAVWLKFLDQAVSSNTSYNPSHYPDGKVPMQILLKDLLTAYKYGHKTLYYHNTRDGSDDTQDNLDDGCAGGACKI